MLLGGKPVTFGHSPEVFTTFDGPSVGCLDILCRTDDGEGDSINQDACVVGAFVVGLDRGGVDADSLCGDDLTNLIELCELGNEVRAGPMDHIHAA